MRQETERDFWLKKWFVCWASAFWKKDIQTNVIVSGGLFEWSKAFTVSWKIQNFQFSMGCNRMQLKLCKADVPDMGDEKSYVEKAMIDCT